MSGQTSDNSDTIGKNSNLRGWMGLHL